ncbi:hypothetical protein GGR57DRAFT_75332 [Xylariaceae sp. FL1272]|nr:hypothetical protein GGR57DRAFT_75332 [Xylariaceae sp. FL1272]
MEHGLPETKRPRLHVNAGSWSTNTGVSAVSLPQPHAQPPHAAPHHPSVSGPPPHHAPSPYPPAPPYSRPPEPHPPMTHGLTHDDRRHHHHHDHDPYPPIQDTSRQPPPSPAHPSYPPYARGDPVVVKRDVGDEQLHSQSRRPSSTGHMVDGLPPTPHGPPHPNQHVDDLRHRMSIDNSASMPHSPAHYRPTLPPSYHQPPTPVGQPPHYEGSHGYGTAHPMYPAALEVQAAASAKRKAQRASQACDNCRQLKAKCDETKPCKNCREKNVECKYRDPPAKQPDKITADILEVLSFLKEEMGSMRAEFNVFNNKLNKMDNRLSNFEGSPVMHAGKLKHESIEQDDHTNLQRSPLPDNGEAMDDENADLSSQGRTTVVEGPITLNQAHETLRYVDDDDIENQPGPVPPPGKPTMPQNHTTLASLLLKWPSISTMLHQILQIERIYHVEEYPIRQEMQRGVLKIAGRGESYYPESKTSDKGTPQDRDWSITDVEEASDIASSTLSPESWGQIGDLSPPSGVDYKATVLGPSGNPSWDHKTLWSYVDSFKASILSMHPIMIPQELDAMVRVFIEQLPKASNTNSTGHKASGMPPRFIHTQNSAGSEVGTKRKRSPGGEEHSPVMSFRKPGLPYKNIESCLVLLVFALGKICQHEGKIPDVVHDHDDLVTSSPMVRNGILQSPSQGSPPGGIFPPSQSSGLPSPKESGHVAMSRRSSFQGGPPPTRNNKRNLDVIPGLEYFALASDIMGGDYGMNNLKRVYVHILAGLYHGQLGRVLESWDHISLASKTLQVILRPSLDRLSRVHFCSETSRRDNQLAYAFWTCLQLESDILAELPLPQSGILQYEAQMPYPSQKFSMSHGYHSDIIEGYFAQLYLRKQLNNIHNLFYDPAKEAENALHHQAMEHRVEEVQQNLRDARDKWVPIAYRWNEGDPPANQLLTARLRAKYWGSQVILYRPFLKTLLDREPQTPSIYQNENTPIRYAALAIDALIESTRAFHGVENQKRIIITNVFGTAHAQWGNLLTLSACYKDDTLRQFINGNVLSSLFSRTIAFFKTVALPSSALTIDLNMLTGLARELGFEPEPRADSSFSSATSSSYLPPIHYTPNYNQYHGVPSPSLARMQ